MTTKEMIAVMEHFDRGGKIEIREYRNGGEYWIDDSKPEWNFSAYRYRIKPEPKVIPWTVENAPTLFKAKSKFKSEIVLLQLVYANSWGTWSFSDVNTGEYISFVIATRDYIQLDGSPCGTIVNE